MVTYLAGFLQWTPLGFMYQVPDSMFEISKERFQGTILKAVSRSPPKQQEVKQEKEGSNENSKVEQKLRLTFYAF